MTALGEALTAERPAIDRALWAGALVSVSTVGLASTSAWLIVRASERPAILSLTVPMGLVQLFALAKAAGRYLERTATHRAALSVMGRVRASVARRLEPLVPAGLGPDSASVVDLAVRDVDRVQDLLTAVAAPLAAGVVGALVAAAVSGVVVPAAAAVLALAVVASLALALGGARWAATSETSFDGARTALVALVAEVARDPDGVATGEGLAAVTHRLDALETERDRARSRASRVRGLVAGLVSACSGLGAAMALVVTASARHGHLAAAIVAVPVVTTLAALELVGGIGAAMTGWRSDRAAIGRLEALGSRVAPVVEVVGPSYVLRGEVCATHVRVAHDGRDALQDASLAIAPGEVVVIRGPSGAGKTTLAWALAKFVDPSGGRVSLAGHDYAGLSTVTVRRAVGYVDDAPYVFATTLAGNLRVVAPDATDEELLDALEAVGLTALLELSGLARELGGASLGLSGGERTRLGVARALLAKWPIVVLDEPTEGLDGATASRVLASVASRVEGAVIISHREGDEAVATRVVELVAGRVER